MYIEQLPEVLIGFVLNYLNNSECCAFLLVNKFIGNIGRVVGFAKSIRMTFFTPIDIFIRRYHHHRFSLKKLVWSDCFDPFPWLPFLPERVIIHENIDLCDSPYLDKVKYLEIHTNSNIFTLNCDNLRLIKKLYLDCNTINFVNFDNMKNLEILIINAKNTSGYNIEELGSITHLITNTYLDLISIERLYKLTIAILSNDIIIDKNLSLTTTFMRVTSLDGSIFDNYIRDLMQKD